MTRARLELPAVLGVATVLRLGVLLAAAGSPQRYYDLDDASYFGIARHLHASYIASSGHWFDVGLLRSTHRFER